MAGARWHIPTCLSFNFISQEPSHQRPFKSKFRPFPKTSSVPYRLHRNLPYGGVWYAIQIKHFVLFGLLSLSFTNCRIDLNVGHLFRYSMIIELF
jgi:hypothetical protein